MQPEGCAAPVCRKDCRKMFRVFRGIVQDVQGNQKVVSLIFGCRAVCCYSPS